MKARRRIVVWIGDRILFAVGVVGVDGGPVIGHRGFQAISDVKGVGDGPNRSRSQSWPSRGKPAQRCWSQPPWPMGRALPGLNYFRRSVPKCSRLREARGYPPSILSECKR